MNNPVDLFLQNTYSLSQVRIRLLVLKSYLSQRFFHAPTISLSESDLFFVNSLGEDFFKQFSPTNLDASLEKLSQDVKALPHLIIFVPFDIPEEDVNKIGIWLRTNTKQKFVFETKIDPDLIGGCALSYKGIYKDFSLRLKIEENKQKIKENLNSYLKKNG